MSYSSFHVYNASAGSGKTYSLVKSYLKVLLQSNQYEPFKNVLAITFTNKAVTEMKERIIDNLKRYAEHNIIESGDSMFNELSQELNLTPSTLHIKSKKLLYGILRNYSAFDISTIDKFTQKLIRTFAFDLNLPLNFEVELDTESLVNKAVDNLISRAGSQKELTNLLLEFAIEKADDDKSWDIAYDFKKMAKILTNENDISHIKKIKNKTLADFKDLKKNLKKRIQITETEIIELSNKALDLISESSLEHSDFSRSTLPNHFIKLSKLELYRLYDNKLQENLTNRQGIYNKTLNPSLVEIIEAILPEIEASYLSLKKLVYHHKFLAGFYKNITPLSVLNLINSELDIIKEEQNKLMISEFNSLISNEINNQPTPFIYERIGEKFKHYFIDEFQDTSQMQWENLIPLIDNALSSENASAMIVGDAKQAIYRWRGGKADLLINLFNQTENPFNIDAKVTSLDTNYRSSKAVVEFNNSFFQHLSTYIFSEKIHEDLYQNCTQNLFSKHKGFVNLSFLNISKDENRDEIYPEQVLKQIQHCIECNYSYNDICVLVRKTKDGIATANYLSDHGVSIISSETLAITRSPEVNFIIASLNYLINPSINEYKIDALKFLAKKFKVKNKHEFYKNRINLNMDEFYKSFQNYNIEYNPNEALQLSIYEIVEGLIYHFKLVSESNIYVQFFLDFVFNFSNKNISSISDFLNHYEEKKDKLKISSSSNSNSVQIMTIHKSKGLEFPIVIFPYADLDIYKEVEPKVWFSLDKKEFNGFSETLLNYNKDIAEFGEQGINIHNKHKAELELDNINLLYVALTRAVEKLYIISNINFDSKGLLKVNEKLYSGLFINFLKNMNLWDKNKLSYSFGEEESIQKELSFESLNNTTSYQKQFISIPKKEHNINILTKSGALWDTNQKEAIEKGNLIHDIMAQIKTSNDIDIAISSFKTSGIINEAQEIELEKLINTICSNPILKPYFTEDYSIYNERDIITKDNIVLRPDRLAIKNNTVIILDYKSGKPDKKHKQQLQIYQDALEQMNFFVMKKILIYINEQLEIKEF